MWFTYNLFSINVFIRIEQNIKYNGTFDFYN